MSEPNPGSDAARALGCRCPVLDNSHGRGFPWPRTDGLDPEEYPSFWVNGDCPLHGFTWPWLDSTNNQADGTVGSANEEAL